MMHVATPRRRATDSYGNASSPFIETFTGIRFRPLDPQVADIRVADIAHALSQQCRFAGHCRDPYSVAEHSVRVSWLLEEWRCTPVVQLWGLLHDASEAYLVDIPAPLKRCASFAVYREAEDALMQVICERFDLPTKEPEKVLKADAVLLATEARDLMPYRSEHWTTLVEEPLAVPITPWAQREAERKFLHRFAELYGRV